MADRELLELAAKAAGVFLTRETLGEALPGFEWDESYEPIMTDNGLVGTVTWCDGDGEPAGTEKMFWNPLADDGDALRLAVKLWIEIRVFNGRVHAGQHNKFWYTELVDCDDCEATRRAIVRAAAAMGRRAGWEKQS